MADYKVVGAYVPLRLADGGIREFYTGGVFSDSEADAAHLAHLLDVSLVAKGSDLSAGVVTAAPSSDASDQVWRDYAAGLGVDVPKNATQAQVREAVSGTVAVR